MKNELKFTSQVCTDIHQSQRLLEMGLKPETADMVLFKSYDLPQYPFDYTFNQDPNALVNCSYVPMVKGNQPHIQDGNIPAWSLHRLLEIYSEPKESCCIVTLDRTFDDLIDDIEWSINKGYLNKEYLKQ